MKAVHVRRPTSSWAESAGMPAEIKRYLFQFTPLAGATSDNAGTSAELNQEFCRIGLVMTGRTSSSSPAQRGRTSIPFLYDNCNRWRNQILVNAEMS